MKYYDVLLKIIAVDKDHHVVPIFINMTKSKQNQDHFMIQIKCFTL